MATKADLQAVLAREHIGRHNGIAAELLALVLGCEARHVRALVTELREQGVAVCGHPKTGYFIAQTPEELESTCQFLRSRAMHSLVLESKLRHVPLPELLGQLRLKT
jgi:biotin operon repressor